MRRLLVGCIVGLLVGCQSTPETPPNLPPLAPDLACVRRSADDAADLLAERFKDPPRKTLVLVQLVNRTDRVVDTAALDAEIEKQLRARNVVDVVAVAAAGQTPPPSDLRLRTTLIDTPVDSEPGTTIFRVDMVLSEGDNTFIAQLNGIRTWKEVLPPAE